MPRYLFETSEIFFPVELCRLYWESPIEKDMFGNLQTPCDDFMAVVDMERKYVFSTVTKDYRLILNKDASDLGFDLFTHLFHLSDNRLCYATRYCTTLKRSEFEIDIVRDFDVKLPFANDGWRPMVKVVNSYNKHRKLSFNIGYCRVNKEGLSKGAFLIPGLSVELNSAHDEPIRMVRRHMFKLLEENPNMEMLNIEKQFQEKMQRLKELKVTEKGMLPLFCKIYDITYKKDGSPTLHKNVYEALRIASIIIKENVIIRNDQADAYTFFYAMMDYATNCEKYASRAQTITSQLRLGGWLNDFIDAASKPEFDFNNYVGKDALRTAQWYWDMYERMEGSKKQG